MDSPNILNYAFGLVQALGGAWCWHLYNRQGKAEDTVTQLTKELADHKLHTSETYMTKTEMTRAFDAIHRSLESLNTSMTQRFDKVDEKLDRKADKT